MIGIAASIAIAYAFFWLGIQVGRGERAGKPKTD